MARQMKKVFHLNKKIELHQWEAHYDQERKAHAKRDAALQLRREAGEVIPPVVETSITTYGKWQAKGPDGQVLQWSSADEDGEEATSSRRRAHSPDEDNL